MSSVPFDPVWIARWETQKAFLTDLAKNARPHSRIYNLIEALKAFGAGQFDFFYNGFTSGKLLPAPLYPPLYTLRTTLDQIGHDTSVIITLLQQRQNGHESGAATLATADSLAQLALNLASGAGLLDGKPATAVTYFHKSAHIRIIPYAPTALIGIPFSCVQTTNDFLAIPHEVGHYVFRHTPALAATLQQQIKAEPEWILPWLEEIFADVFGCLVAGPVIGLDFQDLLADDAQEQFLYDDGHHPVPAVRPFLYAHILALLGFKHAAAVLEARWLSILNSRQSPQRFTPAGTDTAVSLDTARQALVETASLVLTWLDDLVPSPLAESAWTTDLQPKEAASTLYSQFADWLADTKRPAITLPTLNLQNGTLQVLVNDRVVNERPLGTTDSWIDTLKPVSSLTYPIPVDVWGPVLFAGGWNTSGPGAGWPPGANGG